MEIGVQRDCPPYPKSARVRVCSQGASLRARRPWTTNHRLPITGGRSPEISGTTKSRAWAEAWGAALEMAPTWVLASAAAWPLPMLLQWGWLLAWRSPSE